MDAFLNPFDYPVHFAFDDPAYDTIILSSATAHGTGHAFRVQHSHVTNFCSGLNDVLKPFTPSDFWDGLPVYQFSEPSEVLWVILSDAITQTSSFDLEIEQDYRFIYAVWEAAKKYDQGALAARAAVRLAEMMQDVSPEKALELYSKASKAPPDFTTETLLDAALERACENSILSFPRHIMDSLDSRALLRVVCILSLLALAKKQLQLIYYHPNQLEEQRKHMADMLTSVIEALSGTALTLPSGTKVLSRQVDASIRRLCSMQKHLTETIGTTNSMPRKHKLDSLRGYPSPESLFLMENSLPSALEGFELDIDSDTTEHPNLFID